MVDSIKARTEFEAWFPPVQAVIKDMPDGGARVLLETCDVGYARLIAFKLQSKEQTFKVTLEPVVTQTIGRG